MRNIIILGLIVLFAVSVIYGDDIYWRTIDYQYEHYWTDAYPDHRDVLVTMVGSGQDIDTFTGTFNAGGDTCIVLKVLGVSDSTAADTVAWRKFGGAFTSDSIADSLMTDTSDILTDGSGEDSISFDDSLNMYFKDTVGHTAGDYWYIQLYEERRDTQWVTAGIDVRKERVTGRVITSDGASASNDSLILQWCNAFKSSDTYTAKSFDTISAASLDDTTVSYFQFGSTEDSLYGPYWKLRVIYMGEHGDSCKYTTKASLSGR